MKERVLWRKISRIIMMLAEHLKTSPEKALEIFYTTRTCAMLHDARYGLYLMGDFYILNDVLHELEERQA